jgi:hypothetical protein
MRRNPYIIKKNKADVQNLLFNDAIDKKPPGGGDHRLPYLYKTSQTSQSFLNLYIFHDRDFLESANALKNMLGHKQSLVSIREKDVVYPAKKGVEPEKRAGIVET